MGQSTACLPKRGIMRVDEGTRPGEGRGVSKGAPQNVEGRYATAVLAVVHAR